MVLLLCQRQTWRNKSLLFGNSHILHPKTNKRHLSMCVTLIHFSFWQLVLCEIKSPLTHINFRYLTFHCLYCNYVFVFENIVREPS